MPNIKIPQGAAIAVFLDPNKLQCAIPAKEMHLYADYFFHVGDNQLFCFKSRTTKDNVIATTAALTKNGLELAITEVAGAPARPFKTSTKEIDLDKARGSHLVGYLWANIKDLQEKFGECLSDDEVDPYKVSHEWLIEFSDGTIASIYDWKGSKPSLNGAPWHIGGHGMRAVELLRDLGFQVHVDDSCKTLSQDELEEGL